MTLIGVVSDTHVKEGGKRVLAPRLFEVFRGVDFILHAGDLNTLQVVSDLEVLAPVFAVYGNNCDWDVLRGTPQIREMTVEGANIGLVHGDEPAPGAVLKSGLDDANSLAAACALSHFPTADCVVFGHSHWPLIHWKKRAGGGHVLLFNPGSAGQKRKAEQFSCGLLRVEGDKLEAELVTWD